MWLWLKAFPNQHRSNFYTYTYTEFINLVSLSRKVLTIKSNDIIQSWEDPQKTGGGCVVPMSRFVAASKDDGSQLKKASLSTVEIGVKNGTRVTQR